MEKCRNLLYPYQNKKACTLKEAQSLVGILNFASSVILPGRAILRRFIQLTMQVSENQKFVSINKECKDDVGMWLVFLDEKFISSNTLHLYTDAAQSKGFAGIYGRQYFFGSFPEVLKVINIMTVDFYPTNYTIYCNLGEVVGQSFYFIFH